MKSSTKPITEESMATLAVTSNSAVFDSHSMTTLNKMTDDRFVPKASPENTAEIPQPRGEYTLVMCLCLKAAFGGFVFGWDTGTISGFVNMADFKRRFGELDAVKGEYVLSDVRTGLIVGIFNLGCAIGGLTLGWLDDTQGRRLGLMCVTAVYVFGIVIQISSTDKWYQYFIGRFVSGLAVGGIAVLYPTLISKTAPKHFRGICVSFYQLMITLGIFVGYCTNYGTKAYSDSMQWRIPLGLCFVWAIFMAAGMLLVPEFPLFLIGKRRLKDAERLQAKSNKLSAEDEEPTEEAVVINSSV